MIFGFDMERLYMMNNTFGADAESVGFQPKDSVFPFFLLGTENNVPVYVSFDFDVASEDFWCGNYKDSVVTTSYYDKKRCVRHAKVWHIEPCDPNGDKLKNQVFLDCFKAADVMSKRKDALDRLTHSVYIPLNKDGKIMMGTGQVTDFKCVVPKFMVNTATSNGGEPVISCKKHNLAIGYSIPSMIPLMSSFDTRVVPAYKNRPASKQRYLLEKCVCLVLENPHQVGAVKASAVPYYYDLATPLRNYVAAMRGL